jgi:hypothetical protein
MKYFKVLDELQTGFDDDGVDVAKFTNAELDEKISLPPPCLRAYIQGNPGTGKTFMILTMRNMIRQLYDSSKQDRAVTPTGCSADLIHGETVYRAAKVPAGNKKQQGPITSAFNGRISSTDLLTFCKTWMPVVALFFDESSMASRPLLGWSEDRVRTARQRMAPIYCHIRRRRWGGVPLFYLMGDCHQLPPVGSTALFDPKAPSGEPTHA